MQNHDQDWPETLQEYKRFRNKFLTVDGVVLYKGRVVIPEILRQQSLQALHQAHQGESSMILRTHEAM